LVAAEGDQQKTSTTPNRSPTVHGAPKSLSRPSPTRSVPPPLKDLPNIFAGQPVAFETELQLKAKSRIEGNTE
jgi:hypothetical protein